MITGPQIRAARALLNWSAADLAEKVAATRQTIFRLEQAEGVPSTKIQTILSIVAAFEEAGIEFIGTPDDCPGVLIRTKPAEVR